MSEILKQLLPFLQGPRASLPVRVLRSLPYPSRDPRCPGQIHVVKGDGELLVSRELHAAILAASDRARDADPPPITSEEAAEP